MGRRQPGNRGYRSCTLLHCMQNRRTRHLGWRAHSPAHTMTQIEHSPHCRTCIQQSYTSSDTARRRASTARMLKHIASALRPWSLSDSSWAARMEAALTPSAHRSVHSRHCRSCTLRCCTRYCSPCRPTKEAGRSRHAQAQLSERYRSRRRRIYRPRPCTPCRSFCRQPTS